MKMKLVHGVLKMVIGVQFNLTLKKMTVGLKNKDMNVVVIQMQQFISLMKAVHGVLKITNGVVLLKKLLIIL